MRRTLVLLALTALAVVGVRAEVLEPVRIVGDSMAPALSEGDVVMVAKLGRRPERGDLVTFPSPQDGERTVKRVVAVGGDTLAIRDAVLSVNGAVVREPYTDPAGMDALYYGPLTVPTGSVLVLGDRRDRSIDSRAYGPVPLEAVTGRVVGRPW